MDQISYPSRYSIFDVYHKLVYALHADESYVRKSDLIQAVYASVHSKYRWFLQEHSAGPYPGGVTGTMVVISYG